MRKGLLVCGVLLVAGCKTGEQASRTEPRYNEPDPVLDMRDREVSDRLNTQTRLAAAKLAASQGRIDDSIQQFNGILKQEPANTDALFGIATLHTLRREYPAAIQTWKRYAQVTDNDANALNNLAKVYELSGDFKQAEIYYLQAINDETSGKQAVMNYGLMLARRNRTDEAEEWLGKALPPAAVQYNLGAVEETRGNIELARTHYRRSLQLDPTLTAARNRLAVIDRRPG
jgi:Tfp pilus assembly protein PilF